ncbi:MAG: hypothetical protein RMX50_01945 [Planktomarina sp.]|jgi:hypothetical protein|nr:hypothetical protein [Planktomarina sp.]MDT2017505.1 hypothetical protein [Planktomarina sp.]|tara:strand:- start:2344 stop:2982 length:639 start_codon:yes stop_codon:yes gene_type:complete
MSETDSFIAEVTEDVRRDRLFGLFRRFGWIPAALIVIIVSGTAYNEWSKSKADKLAQVRGDALLAAMDTVDEVARASALNEIASQGSENIVAQMLAAGGKDENSINFLNAVIINTDQPEYIRDLAKLKLTMIPGAQTKEQKLKTLDILSQPGGIYRNAAVEILVAFELELGNPNKAIEFLKSHIQDAEASRAQVQRMAELLVALGSEPESGN